MDNANELGNQQIGQPESNVGQDESVGQQEESTLNWETQAKYFQSEKDKLQTENSKLKEYREIGQFLESRPDIVKKIVSESKGGQPNQQSNNIQKPDEFDPWEAYNDPSSASYRYRMQEMQQNIDSAINKATSGIRKQTGRANLKADLTAKGLTPEEINSFIKFTSQNPAKYGVDNVLKMWRAVSQAPAQGNTENPLDQVRNIQSQPQSGGVLQGQRPKGPRTDNETMWDGIMAAGDKNVF